MKINIKGPIVSDNEAWIYDYFEMESTSPKKIQSELDKANGQSIDVDINSGGGSVFAGSEIYTAIKSYKGDVTVRIVGLAASAASVIAMAGKKVMMSPTAQLMIHNVSACSEGDYNAMEHTAEILKNANETVANAYKLKTGKSLDDLLGMMNKETWFSAEKAKESGFIDEIMFEPVQLVASFSGMLPPEVVKNMMTQSPQMKAQKRLTLLKGETNE